MKKLKRIGNLKRQLRNLIKRGRIWYWKKMVHGKVKFISLETEDLELAKARRNQKEALAVAGELEKITGARSKAAAMLDAVFEAYDAVGGITRKAMNGNKSALMTMAWEVSGNAELEPGKVSTEVLTKKFVRHYQDALRARYEAEAGNNEKARRAARDRADRTSKSTFSQAKSIFTEKRSLLERYEEKGLFIPACVKEFAGANAVGKWSTKVYFPPDDRVLTETFSRIEEWKERDMDVYRLFWCALGTGCRKNEMADAALDDFVELNGQLWIGSGLGKDGKQIQIPVINWAVHPASGMVPERVIREMIAERTAELEKVVNVEGGNIGDAVERIPTLFGGSHNYRHDMLPKRLNEWLTSMGWKDEKKMHGLRAYIGCRIFNENPRRAQRYLRHKSIKTTEEFYGHFLDLQQVVLAHGQNAVQTVGQQAA